jgi:hypothetical protein
MGCEDSFITRKKLDAVLVGPSLQMYDKAGYAVLIKCRGSIQQVYVSIMLKIWPRTYHFGGHVFSLSQSLYTVLTTELKKARDAY